MRLALHAMNCLSSRENQKYSSHSTTCAVINFAYIALPTFAPRDTARSTQAMSPWISLTRLTECETTRALVVTTSRKYFCWV